MPKLSVWAVRLSLLYLVAGTALGGLLLMAKAVVLPPWLWALRPLHVEVLLFGFLVQFIFGVAFWILPRAPHLRAKGGGWPLAALLLLNLGLWLVGAAALWGGLEVAGRTCETAAAITFAAHAYPRVRAVRQHS